MTPRCLTISSPINGNCLQACVASLLDLELEEVPNFVDHDRGDDGSWFSDPEYGMNMFLDKHGYEYMGCGNYNELIQSEYGDGVGGYHIGIVNSVNFKGSTHAVVLKGLDLAHDPSPVSKWNGTGNEAICYYFIRNKSVKDFRN